MTRIARAVAHSNIALAKYWGKLDAVENLPAVPSLSLTLDELTTTTDVAFSDELEADELWLDGRRAQGRPLERVRALLDEVRRAAQIRLSARVDSKNDFPTAAGLASSASGFAALALAATSAVGLNWSRHELSSLARQASASAARSLFGGFVALEVGQHAAEPVADADHWSVRLIVAVTETSPKAVASSEGMRRTARTSPYYRRWLEHAPELYRRAHAAVLGRDLTTLGQAMEQSSLMMHASMFVAEPALIYFSPTTLRLIQRVQAFRSETGIGAYFTIDAGPHVKVLTLTDNAPAVEKALLEVEGVERVISCAPGPAAYVMTP